MAPDRDELLERDTETAALRLGLAEARAGRGGIVVVEAAAGAGKTALVAAVRRDAADAGVRVRAATGGELEREFPFGVVRQLLEPVVRAAAPTERAELLAGAAALAGPVLGIGDAGGTAGAEIVDDASFATLHGLYWLVAALTERAPLVLVVDDAQWADEPSLRFCDFLARRAPELPLLLVVALRPDEPGAAHDLLAGIVDGPTAVMLRPAALSLQATTALLRAGLGTDPADDVAAAAHDATGGNPLLVRELTRTLADAGAPPSADDVRAAVPSSVARSVDRRLRRLDDTARRTIRALAVLGDRLPPDVLASAGGLDPAELGASLATLRATGLLEGDPVRFVHPLVREAVTDGVAPEQRADLHRRAARTLRDVRGEEERLVVHLLAAPPTGEPWVVPVLRAAAVRAAEDGAPELAARRLRRALDELPHGAPESSAVLLDLGLAELSAGDARSVPRLEEVAQGPDPVAAARALGTIVGVGAVVDATVAADAVRRAEELLTALEGTEHTALRNGLEAQLMSALTLDVSLAGQRRKLLERIGRSPSGSTPMHRHMLCVEAAAGDSTRDEGITVLRRAAATTGDPSLRGLEGHTTSWKVTAALLLDAPEEVADVVGRTRRAGGPSPSRIAAAFADYDRAMWECRFGSVALAEATARAAWERFAEFDGPVLERSSRAELVGVLTLLGRLDEAERLCAPVTDDEFAGLALVGCTWWTRRAELRLAQGRPGDAVHDLRRVADACEAWGWRRFLLGHGRARLPYALAATGNAEEALVLATAEVSDAVRRGVASDEALAHVALGRATEGPVAAEAFAAGAEAGVRSPTLPVRAEALVEHGAALRRSGHRTDAREVLGRARDAAHRAGAVALLRRATDELAIAGGRPRRIALSGVEALTPSERRVAQHAADGLTNRQIAETLFVTRKTVESTLGQVFQKLDIRSRTQLAGILGVDGGDTRD